MMANDAKSRVQKIQAKIDALKKKRETKLAKADGEFEKTRREATNRHNKSYKRVMQEYDPKIAELEEKRKTADREARQVWEELQKPKKPAKG
jgi:molecular chaperone GrpE (heat shock protein)